MSDDVRQFILESLEQMNYDITGVGDDTPLGPAGIDLESLALAELAVRAEDRYGVTFSEDESEEMAGMTLGELITAVTERREDLAKTPGAPE